MTIVMLTVVHKSVTVSVCTYEYREDSARATRTPTPTLSLRATLAAIPKIQNGYQRDAPLSDAVHLHAALPGLSQISAGATNEPSATNSTSRQLFHSHLAIYCDGATAVVVSVIECAFRTWCITETVHASAVVVGVAKCAVHTLWMWE